MEEEKAAFQIDERDNVATALKKLEPGQQNFWETVRRRRFKIKEEIPAGHKVA